MILQLDTLHNKESDWPLLLVLGEASKSLEFPHRILFVIDSWDLETIPKFMLMRSLRMGEAMPQKPTV